MQEHLQMMADILHIIINVVFNVYNQCSQEKNKH